VLAILHCGLQLVLELVTQNIIFSVVGTYEPYATKFHLHFGRIFLFPSEFGEQAACMHGLFWVHWELWQAPLVVLCRCTILYMETHP
jgi:hypothetical protein